MEQIGWMDDGHMDFDAIFAGVELQTRCLSVYRTYIFRTLSYHVTLHSL